MRRSSPLLLAAIAACAGTGAGFAQTTPTAPAAYVYVQSSPTSNPATYRIYGFAAAANGSLRTC